MFDKTKKLLTFLSKEVGDICVDILDIVTSRISPPFREMILLLGLATLAVTLIRILF